MILSFDVFFFFSSFCSLVNKEGKSVQIDAVIVLRTEFRLWHFLTDIRYEQLELILDMPETILRS